MKSPPAVRHPFRQGDSVRRGAMRLVRAWGRQVESQVGRLEENAAEAVHATRLALKRFRALVRLVRSALGARRSASENARLRRAARGLAAARESAVMGKTLSGLGRSLKGSAAATVRRVGKGMEAREGRPGKVVKRAMEAAVLAVRRTAGALEEAAWSGDGWAVLEAGLRRGYRRARRRFRKAGKEGTESAFHDWRTAVKSLMYQLMVLAPPGGRGLAREIRALDAIQDRLGDEHDLTDLLGRLKEDRELVGGVGTSRRVAAQARRRRERLRREVLKAGRAVFEESTRRFLARREREWAASRKR